MVKKILILITITLLLESCMTTGFSEPQNDQDNLLVLQIFKSADGNMWELNSPQYHNLKLVIKNKDTNIEYKAKELNNYITFNSLPFGKYELVGFVQEDSFKVTTGHKTDYSMDNKTFKMKKETTAITETHKITSSKNFIDGFIFYIKEGAVNNLGTLKVIYRGQNKHTGTLGLVESQFITQTETSTQVNNVNNLIPIMSQSGFKSIQNHFMVNYSTTKWNNIPWIECELNIES